jgi:hypothetical protein
MKRYFTPPENINERDILLKCVFLAGSIEMGKAEDWQTDIKVHYY